MLFVNNNSFDSSLILLFYISFSYFLVAKTAIIMLNKNVGQLNFYFILTFKENVLNITPINMVLARKFCKYYL